jgi:hypothetical protein
MASRKSPLNQLIVWVGLLLTLGSLAAGVGTYFVNNYRLNLVEGRLDKIEAQGSNHEKRITTVEDDLRSLVDLNRATGKKVDAIDEKMDRILERRGR